MHNVSFDKSQHTIVQSRRVSTLDDHTSLAQCEEQMIMSDMHKHPVALVDATRAYVKATSLSVLFQIEENEWMAKLQMTKQGGELVTTSARVELKKVIRDEVLSLDTVMQVFYSKFGAMHKAVFHLNSW